MGKSGAGKTVLLNIIGGLDAFQEGTYQSGALDAKTGKSVMESLMGMNLEGMALIVVTHDEDVASYCSRKIVLADGRVEEDWENAGRYGVSSI